MDEPEESSSSRASMADMGGSTGSLASFALANDFCSSLMESRYVLWTGVGVYAG